MSEKEGVGVRIKKIRLNLDLSQKEFSETMEVTQSLLSMIENGKSMPTTIFINRLCDKFNASINYIHNGAGEMFSVILYISDDTYIIVGVLVDVLALMLPFMMKPDPEE